jgi:hypothetical protein
MKLSEIDTRTWVDDGPWAAQLPAVAAATEGAGDRPPGLQINYIAALIFNTLQLKTLPALQGLVVVHVTCTSFGKFSNRKSSVTNDRFCPLGADGLAHAVACPTILQFSSFLLSSQSLRITCTCS